MFKIINFSFHKCCNVKYSDIQYISACTWECGALVFNQYLCTEVKSCVFNLWSAGLCVQILQYYKTPLCCMIKRMEKYKNFSDTEWATESGVLKPNDCFWFLPNQSNVLDRISGWRGGRGVSVRILCNVHLRWTASLNHRLLMPDPLFCLCLTASAEHVLVLTDALVIITFSHFFLRFYLNLFWHAIAKCLAAAAMTM